MKLPNEYIISETIDDLKISFIISMFITTCNEIFPAHITFHIQCGHYTERILYLQLKK